MDLRRAVGSPPQTTMRMHMRTLTNTGILERHRQRDFPGSVDYALAPAGRHLTAVARVVQAWLASSPEKPLELGSQPAKSAIKALVDGWNATIVRAVAAKPFSLTELNKLISSLNYPSLERRFGALRFAGLIEPYPGQTRGTPYAATELLRRAVAPLAAATRWERRHLPEATAPIGRIDVEAAFLLTIPMLRLPVELSGSCRLAVEAGGASAPAGVLIEVEEGRIVSCVARLQGRAGAWASGTAAAWIQAVTAAEADRLEVGGASELAIAVLEALHGSLVQARQRT
jgi:DNA-binding HxlR family transcriptional regulator